MLHDAADFGPANHNNIGMHFAPSGRSPTSATGLSVIFEGVANMMVDLKSEWTDADIAELIASVEDNRDWRLEVDANGIAQLSDKTTNPTGPEYDEGLHCFMETWALGTDFVGRHAASDKDLVSKIAKALRENYPTLKAEKFVWVGF
jgi:hypothetical protein